MNGLSLLIIIIVIAYFYNQRYPQSDTYKMYFGGAVILYLIFIYFMNYQQPFVYKMARNKAKQLRSESVKAYLEAKKIKELYMLDIIESSEEEYDTDDEMVGSDE